MSFFMKQPDDLYQRFDESHYQRTFTEDTYKKLLNDIGFTNITTFVDFDINNHDENGVKKCSYFIYLR